VLFVVVFKTPLYSETLGAENYRDYVHFLGRVKAAPLKLSSKEAQGHKLVLQGKDLIFLHERYELEG
jgi:hypothetical protein